MSRHRLPLTVIALAASAIGSAWADSYPVGGTWTYDNASEKGPAKICGKRIMTFSGGIREDTGTSSPKYRNVSVTKNGATTWRVIDEFYTLQIWGRLHYTLRQIDEDHIELEFDKGGKRFLLRRCA